jgi:hypothetical protein
VAPVFNFQINIPKTAVARTPAQARPAISVRVFIIIPNFTGIPAERKFFRPNRYRCTYKRQSKPFRRLIMSNAALFKRLIVSAPRNPEVSRYFNIFGLWYEY